MIKFIIGCALIFVLTTNIAYSQTQRSVTPEPKTCCAEWHKNIIHSPDVKLDPIKDLSEIEFMPKARNISEKEFLNAVECLLQLQNNKEKAAFSGATSIEYSGAGGNALVEVAALYYISFLYYDNWTHGTSINLINRNGDVDRPEDVNKAYESYRKWFKKVKEIGLEKARQQMLDPLAGSGIRWY